MFVTTTQSDAGRKPSEDAVDAEPGEEGVADRGSPLNRDHRNVVRWYQNAEDFIVVNERIAAHPVFERLQVRGPA